MTIVNMNNYFNKFCKKNIKLVPRLILLMVAFFLLFELYLINNLLFHSAVGIVSLVISGGIFMVSWNSRHFIAISYFTILGIGYLAVSIFDFLHIFSYPGIAMIPNLHQNSTIQLWVTTRLVASISFFLAAVFVNRAANSYLLPMVALCVCLIFVLTIVVWPVFPTCYTPEEGFTFFKIGSELVIIIFLAASLYLLQKIRLSFEKEVRLLLYAALWVTIASGVISTLHTDIHGISNMIGHILRLISFCIIYMAIIKSGLMRPYHRVVDELRLKESTIKEKEEIFQTVEKKINRELLESEAKFRLLVEKIVGVFWIATKNFDRILYVSPGYEKIWQQPIPELYSDPGNLEKNIHFKDRQRVMKTIKSASKGRWELEYRIVRPDGGIRWIHDSGYPVEDGGGKIIKLCGMAYDITKQKLLEHRLVQAGKTLEHSVAARTNVLSTAIGFLKKQVKERSKIGEKLKERNLMLKTLVQAIPDMVSYKDLQGRYLIANSAHKAFWGLQGKVVIGSTDQQLKAVPATKVSIERENSVLKDEKATRFEDVLCSAAGCTSHWDIRKIPVKDSKGQMVGMLSLARDISTFKQREFQLQQSKAMLQAFLNGISDPMLMVDKDFRVVYSNRSAFNTYFLNNKWEEPPTCANILWNKDGEEDSRKIKSLISRREAISYERRRSDPDQVEKVYLYPLSEGADGLDGAVVRIADITEAKKLELHFIHSEKMNALGLLVAGMVHEINNPNSFISFNLPILKAYLEKIFILLDSHPAALADKDWFGMNYNEFRSEIFGLTDNLSHGSSRIDGIISNLKSMTHPKQNLIRRKWVDMSTVLDKAVMLCRREIRKRVKVFGVEPPSRSIQLNTDPEALEQVVINLLINASHAADKKDSWVRIEARPSEDLLNYAIITVSDNGCGMDQATLSRIFDPFFTTKGPGVGTGLGLSVSYNIVRQLGGEILVDSVPEEGSRFRIVLPYQTSIEAGPMISDADIIDTGVSFKRRDADQPPNNFFTTNGLF